MTELIIIKDPLRPSEWKRVQTDNPAAEITRHFSSWPSTARIYDIEGIGDDARFATLVAQASLPSRDLTPNSEAGVERLARHSGRLMVVVPPADLVTAIIVVVAVIAAVAATLLLMPHGGGVGTGEIPSPNNSLSDRSNRPRLLQRIEDILGQVRSTFTMLAVPYSTYIDHQEVEIALMAIGRGTYLVEDVRDDDTLISSIAGAAVTIYGPHTSPNGGDYQLRIGTPIDDPVVTVVKSNDVNGQVLRAPNANYIRGANNIRFTSPDRIETSDSGIDFTKYFGESDTLSVSNANFGGTSTYDTVLAHCRCYPDKTIQFDAFDPTTLFFVGEQITLTNAVYTGVTSGGAPITVDLSGTYTIATLTTTHMGLA